MVIAVVKQSEIRKGDLLFFLGWFVNYGSHISVSFVFEEFGITKVDWWRVSKVICCQGLTSTQSCDSPNFVNH